MSSESHPGEDIAGVVSPELGLLVSSDVGASEFLHQDPDDADEQDEVDLMEGQSRTSVTSNGRAFLTPPCLWLVQK